MQEPDLVEGRERGPGSGVRRVIRPERARHLDLCDHRTAFVQRGDRRDRVLELDGEVAQVDADPDVRPADPLGDCGSFGLGQYSWSAAGGRSE
ncbi:hypothetical protein [Blastococcus goldschmidtiae]|uniref:Uncharacterized protein n=1 Tax=Blastococcus goldschmidtiae TaxID=3075546 RepID=A0ABU2K7G1_9ACTN|nr:hypothetical protein [Blastococcus sp. DSM 46792]MDT0276120.1 hypothetical protein [Blastococcus sp. DSM 46792]